MTHPEDAMTDPVLTVELTELPEPKAFEPGLRRAPSRGCDLNRHDTILALKNALRYVPQEHHAIMAPEFLEELRTRGRIYGYRYRPAGRITGRPIDTYIGRITEARAMQVMIDNNLDFDVALYPYELVTYGEIRTGVPELDAVPAHQALPGDHGPRADSGGEFGPPPGSLPVAP